MRIQMLALALLATAGTFVPYSAPARAQSTSIRADNPGAPDQARALATMALALAAAQDGRPVIGNDPGKYYDGGAKAGPNADHHLATFDQLDFDVFSNQDWDRLELSHDRDVIVVWPDGHSTTGIAQHIADLKSMFTYAPDTRIKLHPIRIAVGEWTAVMGVMEGTFSKPMVAPDGKVIQPTGKTFRLNMATIGRWHNGRMIQEWLFWDNKAYRKQIGLGD
jgi:predicted ester cyclase